jgi:hypothetical protein
MSSLLAHSVVVALVAVVLAVVEVTNFKLQPLPCLPVVRGLGRHCGSRVGRCSGSGDGCCWRLRDSVSFRCCCGDLRSGGGRHIGNRETEPRVLHLGIHFIIHFVCIPLTRHGRVIDRDCRHPRHPVPPRQGRMRFAS